MVDQPPLLIIGEAPAEYDPRWLTEILSGLYGRIDERGVPDPSPDAYTVTNYTPTRILDASTASATDVANVLCTLIADLQARKIGIR